MPTIEAVLNDLVAANRILANETVVDAFGHVSARHPDRSDRFFLSRSRSPELVTIDDIMEFDLDFRPLDQKERAMYAERPIHGAIYKERPDVQAVVHSHAHEIIPFSLTGKKLRPVVHVAAAMGPVVPVWEIRDKFGDKTNLLVTTLAQGHDLACTLGRGRAALMRGHGCVVVGESLRHTVLTAVYMTVNAKLQTVALQFGEPVYLSNGEIEEMSKSSFAPISIDRAWEYWSRRANMRQT